MSQDLNRIFKMKPLKWTSNSLEPFLTSESINYHYDYFYKGYVDKINHLAREYAELQDLTLAEIVNSYTGQIRDTAAQILNHDFFFENITPQGGNPGSRIFQFIKQQFGSYDKFKLEFNQKVIDHFGSGWIWLIYDPKSQFLNIVDGNDSYNPIMDGYIPLLAIDVWEHAYYLDYINDRKTYAERFWKFVNWAMVDKIVSEEIAGDTYKVYV